MNVNSVVAATVYRELTAAQEARVGAAIADLFALPKHITGRPERPGVPNAAAVRAALGLSRRPQPAHVFRAVRLLQVRHLPLVSVQ